MRFKRIYIEITTNCNLSCSFCSKLTRKGGSMTVEQFETIAKQVKEYTNYIYLHIKGEPLVHSELFEILDIAQKYKLKVNLTTNGTLLPKLSDKLIKSTALRQINISLHSFSQQKSAYPNYIENALKFSVDASDAGKFVSLRLWNLDKDRETNEQGHEVVGEIADFFVNKPWSYIENATKIVKQGEIYTKDTLLDAMKTRSVKLYNGIFLSFDSEFIWPSLDHAYISSTGFCHGLRQMVGILCDGTVVPCCLDGNGEQQMGNIFNDSFKSIIESNLFENATNELTNRNVILPLCQKCTFRLRFN